MQDKELYQVILGLDSPWMVSGSRTGHRRRRDSGSVDHPRGTKFCCPECEQELPATTMRKSDAGDIWTRVSTRRSSWLGCLV